MWPCVCAKKEHPCLLVRSFFAVIHSFWLFSLPFPRLSGRLVFHLRTIKPVQGQYKGFNQDLYYKGSSHWEGYDQAVVQFWLLAGLSRHALKWERESSERIKTLSGGTHAVRCVIAGRVIYICHCAIGIWDTEQLMSPFRERGRFANHRGN